MTRFPLASPAKVAGDVYCAIAALLNPRIRTWDETTVTLKAWKKHAAAVAPAVPRRDSARSSRW